VKIHKQILEITGEQVIELPSSYTLLSIQNQDDNICIWYQFEDEYYSTGKKRFVIYGTGLIFNGDDKGYYIGTVIIKNYVWHVYDMGWM